MFSSENDSEKKYLTFTSVSNLNALKTFRFFIYINIKTNKSSLSVDLVKVYLCPSHKYLENRNKCSLGYGVLDTLANECTKKQNIN